MKPRNHQGSRVFGQRLGMNWLILGVVVGGFAASPASADLILYQTSFEAPTFVAGQLLTGQNDWVVYPADAAPAATVVSGTASSGLQSVLLEGSKMVDLSGVYGGYFFTQVPFDPIVAGLPIVNVQTDVMLVPSSNDLPSSDVTANLALYDPDLNYIAEIFIGADSLRGNSESGSVSTPFAVTDSFVTIGMSVNFLTRKVDYLLNGTSFGTLDLTGPAVAFGEADLALISLAPFETVAYFDNYSIRAVPEPTAATLCGLGVVLLGVFSQVRRVRKARRSS